MCHVIAEKIFSVRFHSCRKQLKKKILNNISPKYEDHVNKSQENFFEENTDSDINKLNDLIGNLLPYCYEPEKDASETSGSDNDANQDESSEEENVSPYNVEIRAVHKDWWICRCCKKEIRKIDCKDVKTLQQIQKITLTEINV